MIDRRRFLQYCSFSAASLLLPAFSRAQTKFKVDAERFRTPGAGQAKTPLNILFLGGTNFLGPPTVQAALDRGHQVTLFNRGITNPHLFPQVPKLRGNRFPNEGAGLGVLQGKDWDVVIDTWQGPPVLVKRSAELLAPHTRQYIYISSIAVYGERNYTTQPEITEETPLPPVRPLPEDPAMKVGYPARKQLAELAAKEALGDTLMTIRPHSICGYYMEGADNQLYWPVRVHRGGDILCPGDGRDTTQYIDVVDLAAWIVRACEARLSGVYNACLKLYFDEYLYGLKALTTASSTFHWAPVAFLDQHGVRDYDDMPMWVPRSKAPGFFNVNATRAIANGLTFRPMEQTFRELLAGFFALYPGDYEFGVGDNTVGLSREKEGELLQLLLSEALGGRK